MLTLITLSLQPLINFLLFDHLEGAVASCAYWVGGPYIYNVLLGRGGKY